MYDLLKKVLHDCQLKLAGHGCAAEARGALPLIALVAIVAMISGLL